MREGACGMTGIAALKAAGTALAQPGFDWSQVIQGLIVALVLFLITYWVKRIAIKQEKTGEAQVATQTRLEDATAEQARAVERMNRNIERLDKSLSALDKSMVALDKDIGQAQNEVLGVLRAEGKVSVTEIKQWVQSMCNDRWNAAKENAQEAKDAAAKATVKADEALGVCGKMNGRLGTVEGKLKTPRRNGS